MKKLLFIIVLISGCTFTDELHYSVDPKLKPIVDRFFAEARAHGFNYEGYSATIMLDDIETSGLTIQHEIPVVKVDRNYFNERVNGTEYQRLCLEYIVFHELGHAWISPEHVEGDEDLMSAFGPIHQYAKYPEKREAMLNRFFKMRKK